MPMTPNVHSPKASLNKGYLKQRPLRSDIEIFKSNLKSLLSKVENHESEENKKNHIRDFLLDTYYKGSNEVNTKDRKDLVIHLGKTNQDKVGVIIEAKTPHSPDMVRREKLNTKAFHELVLYYFDERIGQNNSELKNLIVTNIYEWFVFDANVFDKQIYRNSQIKKLYETYKNDRKDNPFFYEELRKILESIDEILDCAYFNLKDYETVLNNADLTDDKNLIELQKILSPYHLLKTPFTNDSNSLNKDFYNELLHIIGLEEFKEKSRSIIRRKPPENRNQGSLIENAITILQTKDSLRKIKNIFDYGETSEDRYFNVALELCITWMNRILFLKLLESQLVGYHKGNRDYRFLNIETIPDFDELFTLFHDVLAKNFSDRTASVKEKYKLVPYLNSSLFEFSELEDSTVSIESIKLIPLPFNTSTVLKDLRTQGRTLNTLEYLFKFLDAYDFASEGYEEIQENNRSLINASILGKIFEKLNGYKDGSIFTPSFITMYMCRQSIRLAVVQKFKETYKVEVDSFEDLKNFVGATYKTDKILEYNGLINSIKLCDPAVGSGHFLVSSLNEIIAIKSELGILADENGSKFASYEIQIENDELIITDENGEFFNYQINPNGKPNKQAHRLQRTLFHEKQALIENCLFGVDINPNSVKICRLRLWIELLKNAYYKESGGYAELETLPNIDINIKCGNSLISRFALDEDLKEVLKKIKYSVEEYKDFVLGYKETRDREKKREFENKIQQIKADVKTQLFFFSPERRKLTDLENQLRASESKQYLFGETEDELKKRLKLETDLKTKIEKAKDVIRQIEENVIYRNAFEWRFEFPEVLDNAGNFLGFDIVIGNPPYGSLISDEFKEFFKKHFVSVEGAFEIYKFFIEFGFRLLQKGSLLCFITPDTWTNLSYFKNLRLHLLTNYRFILISKTLYDVFDEAIVDTILFLIRKELNDDFREFQDFSLIEPDLSKVGNGKLKRFENDAVFQFKETNSLIETIETKTVNLGNIVEVWRGMSAYGAKNPDKPYNSSSKDTAFHRKMLNGGDIGKYSINWANEYIQFGNWLHRPRPSFIYDTPHLLVQRIRNPRLKQRIIATFDNEKFISSDGLSNILITDIIYDLKFILSLLNSSLINYWFSFYFFDVNIKPEQLRKIPIKQISPEAQQPFIKLVDEVLEKKKVGENTSELEKKIDEMVYQIYELTDEEIKIIKGNE